MDPIFDLSAAPHLPHALREAFPTPTPRPEAVLGGLLSSTNNVKVFEYKGEIYIEISDWA